MRIELLAAVGSVVASSASAQHWVPLTPPVLQDTAMTYDVARARTLLVANSVHYREMLTWEHDGSAWRLAEGPAPTWSNEFALTNDWNGRSFLLLPDLQEFWEYGGAGWSRNTTATLPCPTVPRAW
jgi:hypothetical protein